MQRVNCSVAAITDCDDGQYGDDCLLKCGRCVGGVPCNKSTGQCPNGCPPGLLPPLCQTGKDNDHPYVGQVRRVTPLCQTCKDSGNPLSDR